MFCYTKSHGLVSIQFLGVLGIFLGAGAKESKNAINELDENLSYATLSGANNFNFDAISDLIGRLRFPTKKSTLANRDRREKEDAEKAKEITDTTTFVELPDPLEQAIVNDLFKKLEH